MSGLGQHLLAEYSGCDPERLTALDALTAAMLEAARRSGATLVTHSFHRFSPHGVSGVVIIAESHLAIHTWPELGFAAVDFFSCGGVDMHLGLAHLREWLGATTEVCLEVERGPLRVINPK